MCGFYKIIHQNQEQQQILLKSLCHGNTDATGSRCSDVMVLIFFYCLGFSVVNVAFALVILVLAILRVCCYLLFLSLDYKYNTRKAKFFRV